MLFRIFAIEITLEIAIMDPSAVAAIAKDIVENQFLYNWQFHLVLLALVTIATAATSFLFSYFKGRGSNLATKADFNELLDQLRKTTKTTESIKRTISHEDWAAREFKSIRRVKLEELMIALYDTHHWLEKERGASLFAETGAETPDPMHRVDVIAGLYFPELKTEVLAFRAAYFAYQSWLVDSKAKLLPLRLTDKAKYMTDLPATVAEFPKVYQPFLTATAAIEERARGVMKEVLGVISNSNVNNSGL